MRIQAPQPQVRNGQEDSLLLEMNEQNHRYRIVDQVLLKNQKMSNFMQLYIRQNVLIWEFSKNLISNQDSFKAYPKKLQSKEYSTSAIRLFKARQ